MYGGILWICRVLCVRIDVWGCRLLGLGIEVWNVRLLSVGRGTGMEL